MPRRPVYAHRHVNVMCPSGVLSLKFEETRKETCKAFVRMIFFFLTYLFDNLMWSRKSNFQKKAVFGSEPNLRCCKEKNVV